MLVAGKKDWESNGSHADIYDGAPYTHTVSFVFWFSLFGLFHFYLARTSALSIFLIHVCACVYCVCVCVCMLMYVDWVFVFIPAPIAYYTVTRLSLITKQHILYNTIFSSAQTPFGCHKLRVWIFVHIHSDSLVIRTLNSLELSIFPQNVCIQSVPPPKTKSLLSF